GLERVRRALATRRFGPFAVQAAIAAVHASAPSPGATDWREIVALYDVLLRLEPPPVVELNRAVAAAMRDGPDAGLALVDAIRSGLERVRRALATRRFGPFAVQAAIAAVHASAPSPGATDWREIVALYDVLLRLEPSPVVELNRAVAVAMRDGPDAGLALVDAI